MEYKNNDYGETEPASAVEDYGPTEPVYHAEADIKGMGQGWNTYFDETLPPLNENGFEVEDFKSGRRAEEYDEDTLPVIMNGIAGFTPVAGWLVCVDGPAKGSDYRIRAGYNYIGRADHMDICIKGDHGIGRERHAMIAYDPEECVFFFGPADGKSIVRLNGKMVMTPSEVHAYDLLKIGTTKLMFVPFCGERFNWDV